MRLHWKKGDLLAAAVVVLLAVVSLCLLPALRSGGSFAQVYLDGELIREVPLAVDQSFTVRGAYTNTVTVRDGAIAVTHSDCPTNDCVHMGWLRDGGSIVCLPNRVEIRLVGETAVDAVLP